jgi:hypothetical protein
MMLRTENTQVERRREKYEDAGGGAFGALRHANTASYDSVTHARF